MRFVRLETATLAILFIFFPLSFYILLFLKRLADAFEAKSLSITGRNVYLSDGGMREVRL